MGCRLGGQHLATDPRYRAMLERTGSSEATSDFAHPTGLRLPSRGLARTSRSKATSEFAHPSPARTCPDAACLGFGSSGAGAEGDHHDRAVGDGRLPVRGPCWRRPLATRAPHRGAGSPAAGAPATVEHPASGGGRAGPMTPNAIELGGGSVEPGPPAGWPGPANHLNQADAEVPGTRPWSSSSSRSQHPLSAEGRGATIGRGRNRAATPRSRPAPLPRDRARLAA